TLGVAQAEAHILQHLAAAGDSTVGQLHEAFAHRRSTLTSVLDRLEAAGLILRTASRTDRRTFVISLTDAGRTAAVRVHTGLQDVEKKALLGVTERDLKGFASVLQALEGALRRPSEAGPARSEPARSRRRTLF
ncbi:MAG: MarR family winged helix-turn-helix transcriptional regulator, partial [Vicinamibacteria bacterium]|nr:MarR family winged helix-turn-helix transcriptional regulator [Vicinamibacteria bacterium]